METTIVSNLNKSEDSDDCSFDDSLIHLHAHFVSCTSDNSKFFLTDISGDELWGSYLSSLREHGGEATAQRMNCKTCEKVVRKIGGVVIVGEDGQLIPVMWNPNLSLDQTHGAMGEVYADMYNIVSKRKIVSVWRSDDPVIGNRTTTSKSGTEWSHFYFAIPAHVLAGGDSVKNANQLMADSKERFRILMSDETGIHTIELETLQRVVQLLSENELYGSDKFLAQAKFHLHVKESILSKGSKRALLWKAMLDKPIGWANVNSTMIGSLYNWIQSRMSIEDIKRMWNSRVDPSKFQRAQSEPSQGELDTAERIIEKMGAVKSLERRFARLEEIRCRWKPSVEVEETPKSGGVFSSIRASNTSVSLVDHYPLSVKTITWEKFKDTVLPVAESMELKVPNGGGFSAFITATHADAPPIIQWDSIEDRYPVSSYTYVNPIPASNWNLVTGSYVTINAVAQTPSFDSSFILILDGCKDKNTTQGLGLFNEILKPEFHEIRKVMEAFSNKGKLSGADEASACGWQLSRNTCGITVRVKVGGEKREYFIDRFD